MLYYRFDFEEKMYSRSVGSENYVNIDTHTVLKFVLCLRGEISVFKIELIILSCTNFLTKFHVDLTSSPLHNQLNGRNVAQLTIKKQSVSNHA